MCIYLFIYLFVSKAYSSYSSQCRKLKISMSNDYKISQLVRYLEVFNQNIKGARALFSSAKAQ